MAASTVWARDARAGTMGSVCAKVATQYDDLSAKGLCLLHEIGCQVLQRLVEGLEVVAVLHGCLVPDDELGAVDRSLAGAPCRPSRRAPRPRACSAAP